MKYAIAIAAIKTRIKQISEMNIGDVESMISECEDAIRVLEFTE